MIKHLNVVVTVRRGKTLVVFFWGFFVMDFFLPFFFQFNESYFVVIFSIFFKQEASYNLGAQLLEIRDRFEEKWVDLQCRLRGTTRKLP